MAWEDLFLEGIDKVSVFWVSETVVEFLKVQSGMHIMFWKVTSHGAGLLTRELWQKAIVLSVGIKLVLNLFNGAMKF